MIPAKGPVYEPGKAVLFPLGYTGIGEAADRRRFNDHPDWLHISAMAPEATDVMELFGHVFLFPLCGVFHHIRGVFHFPLEPVFRVGMELRLRVGSFGDVHPGIGQLYLDFSVRRNGQENVVMGCPPFLEFQNPQVAHSGTEAAQTFQPGMEVALYFASIFGPLFVVTEHDLAFHQVSGIVADVAKVGPRLVGKFEDFGSASSWHIRWRWRRERPTDVHVPVKDLIPRCRGGGDRTPWGERRRVMGAARYGVMNKRVRPLRSTLSIVSARRRQNQGGSGGFFSGSLVAKGESESFLFNPSDDGESFGCDCVGIARSGCEFTAGGVNFLLTGEG